ncbi:MAG: response regulator, partial [Planctomycetes bacterium]|nr:response regulator [Planctomycetota bacterium]
MAKPLRVLLIDDNPDDRVLVLRELRHEFPDLEAEEPIDSRGLEDALQRHTFDLAITDFQIRWTDGITVLKAVKSRLPACPVIMFTGNEEVAVEAMKVGLDDYVVKKPSHFVRLRTVVRSVLALSQERIRSAQLEARLQTLLGQLNVGVFRCTTQGELLETNDAFLNLLGTRSPESGESRQLPESFLRQEQGLQLVDRLLKTGTPQDVEIEWRRPQGKPIWVRLSATLTTTADGQTVIDGTVEDITARKKTEEEDRSRAVLGARLSLLSPRERDVTNLVTTGKTKKAIAHR